MKHWKIAWSGFCLALVIGFTSGCQHRLPPNSLGTHNSSRWEKDIAAFEASDRTNPPPKGVIVFVGSSSIRLWKTLAQDFPDHKVINRGFGGSQLADSVNYAERIILPHQPSQVVIYAGGNDINAKKTPDVVYGDFVALARKLRASNSQIRIGYIAIAGNPKRWDQVSQVREVNERIARYCKDHGLDFIDVFSLMLGRNGLPLPDIFVADQLHMNERGYAIWKEAVRPYLIKN